MKEDKEMLKEDELETVAGGAHGYYGPHKVRPPSCPEQMPLDDPFFVAQNDNEYPSVSSQMPLPDPFHPDS